MKTLPSLLGGIILAAGLTLGSCGDGDSSAEKSDDQPEKSAEASKPYPLKVCVVSGEELGSMGKPVVIDHEGTEVRFCCKECLPKFNADPAKYIAMLKAGEAGTMEHGDSGQ